MAQAVMRPRKSGGFSICRSPEDCVGKGRCDHVLGFASIVWNSEKGDLTMIDMSGNNIDTSKIDDYIKNISASLSEEKKQKLVKYFRNFS